MTPPRALQPESTLAVCSALESVSIAEVEHQRDELAARFFGAEEFAAIAGRRAQTTAGFLAAKRALVRLFAEGAGKPRFEERDFRLTHEPNGAPRVASLPAGVQAEGKLRISISHTRDFAYALAVLEGDLDG